jgi:hypothetical protein
MEKKVLVVSCDFVLNRSQYSQIRSGGLYRKFQKSDGSDPGFREGSKRMTFWANVAIVDQCDRSSIVHIQRLKRMPWRFFEYNQQDVFDWRLTFYMADYFINH